MLAWIVRGASPFSAHENLSALLIAKATHVPAPSFFARSGLSVPRGLQDLIEKLIRPHPRARPRFAVEVELSALASEVTDEVSSGVDSRGRRRAR